ncbi:alanine racemase [Nocardioides marmoriginsengisoli]|uniref:Alanine racemase n=1 Tax=Nocardioides marmoriginsengisoli TaxID=661483 RepID=A0A3N0CB91_9ACTN|nr:alanine racemase [Nocardioides marmoriginsengisoli]RNL60725.1 alanine racemase [Nocardioides marmoriginsengisoli]
MSLVLHVDGDRWRSHLRAVAEARPGLVPVIKGNGYGFGLGRLARKSGWLGADVVAVGTPSELTEVANRYDGDLLVLTPWRAFEPLPADVDRRRLIHTVDRLEDLEALAATGDRPRVVLELITSMKRHGFTPRGLREAVRSEAGQRVRVEGASLHLPLGPAGGNLAEVETLMTEVVAAGLAAGTAPAVWVSHLSTNDVATLTTRYPEIRFRQRIGTELWLGDRGALRVSAHVLDSHPVERGEVFGYRGRTLARSGTILIVSGGTAHGIGLESPTGESSARARVSTLARGGLDALGLSKSPFTVAGKSRYFAEPPHMQASMLFLPSEAPVPEIGDTVDVRVRFTATTFDAVEIS